jgi:lipopolysaccharide export system permease protein
VKRLHRFIISSFLGPFFLTFFIVIFLLLMQFLWKYIDDLAGKGLPINVLAELMFFVSASLVPMAMPLAVLLASLMTLGNLGEQYELTAMKASGISLPRIMAPLVIMSIVLALAAFMFANYVMPYTNVKMRSLLWDITNQKPELQVKEGVFSAIDQYTIRVGKKDYKTNLMRDVKIYDHTHGQGNGQVSVADSGYMKMTDDKKFLVVTLFSGYNYTDMQQNQGRNRQQRGKNTYPFRRDKFEKQVLLIPMSGFGLSRSDENLFKQGYQMMGIKELELYADSLKQQRLSHVSSAFGNIYQSSLFRYRPIAHQKASKELIDSVKYESYDSVYAHENAHEKSMEINEALSFARDIQSNLSSATLYADDLSKRSRKYEIEWWRKFTLSAACIIFFFIGAPLGAIIRKGGLGMPVVISVVFFVFYYIISITGEKFAKEGVMDASLGMCLSGIILLPLGVFLTYKATRESTLLNVDTYLNFYKKLFAKIKLKKSPKTV